jgi:putative nucleotidyltransferase with HDIG domain
MPASRDIRDPVHGFVRLQGRECEIVDTPIFQRLRRIKQLAMAHLIYPGAVHTRLEHTLGVAHIAGKMAHQLGVDAEATRIIRLAALLHDIGHGPFSHPSEDVLAALASEEGRRQKGATDKIHEVITRSIIRTDPHLRELIAERDRENIITLLDAGWGQRLYKDIVSGPIDADKQDYLLRDSHHCGVRYGVYDIRRLHDVLCRVPDMSEETLAVAEDGVNTLEQFVLARYYLTTQVITHKGRRITDAMLVRALTLGATVDNIPFLRALYTFDPSAAFVDEYVQWNDERLVCRLLEPEHEGTWAGQLMRRLANRRLLKIIFRRPVNDFPDLISDVDRVTSIASDIEHTVSSILGAKPEEVIFKVHRSPPTRKSEGAVLVAGRNGQPQPLESRSAIFSSVDRTLREEYLECYAPLDTRDEQARRQNLSRIDDAVARQISAINGPAESPGESHGT